MRGELKCITHRYTVPPAPRALQDRHMSHGSCSCQGSEVPSGIDWVS